MAVFLTLRNNSSPCARFPAPTIRQVMCAMARRPLGQGVEIAHCSIRVGPPAPLRTRHQVSTRWMRCSRQPQSASEAGTLARGRHHGPPLRRPGAEKRFGSLVAGEAREGTLWWRPQRRKVEPEIGEPGVIRKASSRGRRHRSSVASQLEAR
jgi:hypothetical protein